MSLDQSQESGVASPDLNLPTCSFRMMACPAARNSAYDMAAETMIEASRASAGDHLANIPRPGVLRDIEPPEHLDVGLAKDDPLPAELEEHVHGGYATLTTEQFILLRSSGAASGGQVAA
jgi:hypothetical protein